jgi:hypothetical protein
MTNVYYAVVNSTSCIKKEEKRNKLRSILNPDLLIISFLKIKYTNIPENACPKKCPILQAEL